MNRKLRSRRVDRHLTLEQMEDRLALTTVTGMEVSAFQLNTLASEGGFVVVEGTSGLNAVVDNTAGLDVRVVDPTTGENINAGHPGDWGQWLGSILDDGVLNYTGTGNLVPQIPILNPHEVPQEGGVIEIPPILDPQPSKLHAHFAVDLDRTTDSATSPPDDENFNPMRGRDMAFEVAAWESERTEGQEPIGDQDSEWLHSAPTVGDSALELGEFFADEHSPGLAQVAASAMQETARAEASDGAELPESREASDALASLLSGAFPVDSISDDVQLAYVQASSDRSEQVHEAAFADWQAHHEQLNRVGQPLRVSDREGDHSRVWPVLMLVGAGAIATRLWRNSEPEICQLPPGTRRAVDDGHSSDQQK